MISEKYQASMERERFALRRHRNGLWCQAGAKTPRHTMIHDELRHHDRLLLLMIPLAGCPEVGFRQDSQSAGPIRNCSALTPFDLVCNFLIP